MQVPDNDLEEPHTQFHCKICCGTNRVFLYFPEMMGVQLMEEQTNPDHTKFMKKISTLLEGGLFKFFEKASGKKMVRLAGEQRNLFFCVLMDGLTPGMRGNFCNQFSI